MTERKTGQRGPLGRRLRRAPDPASMRARRSEPPPVVPARMIVPIEIPAGDVLESILLSGGGPLEVGDIDGESDAIARVREAGVELIVPLIGQGELLGALYLGPRRSDQPYSADDRRLLGTLAAQVAPAMKVARLVREQQIEAEERERIQQELEVAALIQQTLLPKELPSITGWAVDAFYRPARAVGGDFYDFVEIGDGRLAVIIGDVTDKGVPAALVMATCRSMLRAAAQRHPSPGDVLRDVNENLVPEIPPAMFVTCLYAIIDTAGGGVVFANAGHNLPYVRTEGGVVELRATGMPLGLMPGMTYEETAYRFQHGDVMVLTSDGITEAHSPDGEMYGFSRLMGQVASGRRDSDVVAALIDDLETWTGPGAEQEDDITLVVVRRTASAVRSAPAFDAGERTVASFVIPSVDGNERLAIDRVVAAVEPVGLGSRRLERLKSAVGETVMNAIEHGNHSDASLDVEVDVIVTGRAVRVRVVDQGGGDGDIPEAEVPDIEAKLSGAQNPRGWGLFLVDELVDEVRRETHDGRHIVEFVIDGEGGAEDG